MNRTGASEQETRKGRGRAAVVRAGTRAGAAKPTGAKASAKKERPKPPPRERANGHAAGANDMTPISARPSRAERASADERMRRIDDVCAAWAAIVAERMAADQQFAELYEAYRTRSTDLRGLFAWDALHAAEAHLTIVNSALARHIGDDGRADPRAVLADLRWEQRKLAAVYAVNAFLAVLNQMSPRKAKWANLEEFDPRIAVLSLAHQTLGYALECLRIEDPGDLTEKILAASQKEPVWEEKHDSEEAKLLGACAAAAAFFRGVGATELTMAEEILSLYVTRARSRT
ncbi:MAG: hypothetical protein J0L92_36725 [Deltaproteobacteria bacterium]|nr:hypothetical protein [Deltaproteobacteria bacterium]